LKLPGHQSLLGNHFSKGVHMTNPTYNFSLRDRSLLRLEHHECIENFHAQRMAENGDIELFQEDANLDSDSFPYPFGNVGNIKIDSLNISDKGRARLTELHKANETNYTAYQQSCRISEVPYDYEQLLYTPQGIQLCIDSGNRDRLVVFNKRIEKETHSKIMSRSVDPDTGEHLITDEQIYALDLDG